jgi:hypothetical protein
MRAEGWRLRNVEQTRFLGDHTDTRVLPDLVWKSELTPEVLSVLMVVPERMSVSTCTRTSATSKRTTSAPPATRSPSGRSSPTRLRRWS